MNKGARHGSARNYKIQVAEMGTGWVRVSLKKEQIHAVWGLDSFLAYSC